MDQGGDDRQPQHGLRDHHGARREEQPERAEQARPGQHEVDEEPHDHGGQSEEGVDENDGGRAAGKAKHRQRGSEGCADHEAIAVAKRLTRRIGR